MLPIISIFPYSVLCLEDIPQHACSLIYLPGFPSARPAPAVSVKQL